MHRTILSSVCAAALLAACAPAAPEAPVSAATAPRPAPVAPDTLAQSLSGALRFPTVANEADPDAEAEAFAGFHAYLAERFPNLHAQAERVALDAHTLVYVWPGSNPDLDPVVFLAHQDVVPVEGHTLERWDHPPFSGAISDGYVYGRGALDMKGHLIALLSAVEALMGETATPERGVIVVLGGDEETGGAGARSAAALLAERGITPFFVVDEGGFIMSENPVTGVPAVMIAIAEKHSMTVRVTTQGRGGHSSTPPEETAVSQLSRAIVQIQERPFSRSVSGGPTREMLLALGPTMGGVGGFILSHPGVFGPIITGQLEGEEVGRALLGTTIAPTVIQGGTAENVLPQQAHALINLRLHPRDSVEDALAHLRDSVDDLEGVEITLEGSPFSQTPVAPTEGEAWRLISETAQAYGPEGAPVVPFMITGATDARAFGALTDRLYRFTAVTLADEDFAGIHGDNERISLDNLQAMTGFFYTLIDRSAVQPQTQD
jgi:carboxypeptidase PM20D1